MSSVKLQIKFAFGLACIFFVRNKIRKIMKNKWIVPAIIIAVGLFLLGQRIEQGIVRSKEAVRTVSVKGLSEREVPADKVIWPLVYKELGNDLGTIYRTINTKNTIVINFLKANGYPTPKFLSRLPES